VFAEETHCWICGRPVDFTLPPKHRLARSVDHLVKLEFGGAPLERHNVRLAHIACNTARSNRDRKPRGPRSSRRW
jgi:5-methylcytosine-specific restriction endonuclease McrA